MNGAAAWCAVLKFEWVVDYYGVELRLMFI